MFGRDPVHFAFDHAFACGDERRVLTEIVERVAALRRCPTLEDRTGEEIGARESSLEGAVDEEPDSLHAVRRC